MADERIDPRLEPFYVWEMPQMKVKYKDVFHLKNLYIMLHEYFIEEKWYGPEQYGQTNPGGATTHGDIESLYLEKFCQKGLHSGGKEMWVYWRLIKLPESEKYSGYYRYILNMDFHVVYLRDEEVMHQGKKMKINWGEIEFFFFGKIEADYRGTWRNHWLLKHIFDWYNEKLISQEFEKREKELWRDVYRATGQLKKFLNLKTFVPVPEPFHPSIYGYEG